MVQRLLLFSLLLLAFQTARAQNPVTDESLASQQFKQRLRGQYLHNDTAQAIITLYSRRQAGGVTWIVSAVLSATRLAIGTTGTTNSSNSPYYTPAPDDAGSRVLVATLVSVPFIAYGIGKLAHYSNAHLSAVLTAYAAGQPLPPALRRKLKPRFFQAPIVKYKEVKYKPVAVPTP